MNTRTRTHYLLVAALAVLAASCTVGERRSYTVERRWPAGAIRHIEINEVDGSLNVEAGQTDEITLVARIRSRTVQPKKTAENLGFFRTEIDGDTLTIAREKKRSHSTGFLFFRTNDLSVDYTLRVPPQVALDLNTVNGRIATRGIEGETEVTSVNGAIELESTGSSEVSARTVNGHVRARFLNTFQGARLKTVNGGVEAILPPTASFACDLSQVNGDFEASFPLNIHSHPGSRRVSGEVNGGRFELKITTVNGDIEVQNGGTPPVPPVPPAPPGLSVPPAPGTAPPGASAPPAAPARPSTVG